MHRIALSTLLATTVMIGTASAGPLSINTEGQSVQPEPLQAFAQLFSAPAPAPAQAPMPQTVSQRQNYGGGFIEMLFGGDGAGRPYDAPGQAAPPIYSSPDPAADAALQQQMRTPLAPQFLPQEVQYPSSEKAGTIVINTRERLLYLVESDGHAMRYGIGVGKPGFAWSGVHHVTNKREWPDWTPPDEMLKRRPDLPRHMAGGPDNPLGARAMYLGSTLYRIHGSNEPWTIGTQVSSGCIRMRNEDVVDLYRRVKVGTKVVVI